MTSLASAAASSATSVASITEPGSSQIARLFALARASMASQAASQPRVSNSGFTRARPASRRSSARSVPSGVERSASQRPQRSGRGASRASFSGYSRPVAVNTRSRRRENVEAGEPHELAVAQPDFEPVVDLDDGRLARHRPTSQRPPGDERGDKGRERAFREVRAEKKHARAALPLESFRVMLSATVRVPVAQRDRAQVS